MKKIIGFTSALLLFLTMSFNLSAYCTDGDATNTGWCTLDQNGDYICQSYGGCSCTCDGNTHEPRKLERA